MPRNQAERLADLLDPTGGAAPEPLAYADDPLGFLATWWPQHVVPAEQWPLWVRGLGEAGGGLSPAAPPEDPRDRLRIAPYQREIVLSVRDNVETIVVSANKMGKDWIAGFLVVWAFACHPVVRIVTTSARERHLKVLWGEIGRHLATSRWPLLSRVGGPIVELSQELRKADEPSPSNPLSYAIGLVASGEGEGLAGHHAPYTFGVIDEASGVDDVAYSQMQGWIRRLLCFGNPNDCPEEQFFRKAATEGDIAA